MKMKKNSFAASSLVLALLLLGTAVYSVPVSAASSTATTTNTDCTPQTSPFSVTEANWGTSGSPVSVYPGDQDVPLTVTMLFSGPCTSPQTTFYLGLTQGPNTIPFTGQNGAQEPKDVALNIAPNTLVTETFYLNIDQYATTGVTYYIPLIIDYSNNTVSSPVTQIAQASGGLLVVPIALYGQVQLNFGAGTTHLLAGAVNNVTISILNSGSAASGPVSTMVTAPAGVTLFNQLATTTTIDPGSSVSQLLQFFVPSSMSGTAFVLTFTAKYLDAYSDSQTATQTVGFMVVSTPTVESSSSFVVEGASWGSAASTTSPLPGTQDTPLMVTLQYLGSTAVTSLQGTVQLPASITDLNGHSTAVAFSSATTNQYGAVTLTFYLNIASSAKSGSYNFTLNLEWMTSESLGLTQTAVLTPPPIAQMESSFQIEGATWQSTSAAGASSTAATTTTAPVPGTSDAPLVVTLQYLGTTSATSLEGTLTLPAGITDLNGRQTATAYAATATPDQVVTLTFNLDVGSSVKPGSYTFALELSWETSVSVGMAESGSVSPPPVAAPTTSFSLSVVQQNSTVTAGSQISAGFQLTNQGTAPIYSPTFSLTVGSPLVLASIGTPNPTAELDPGKSANFVAQVTSGPSATAGIYSGTLTVTFTDSNGASHTQTFPVGFTLQGTIILILQNTAVTQTATGFTVTGSILNEGSASIYYASISGLLGVNTATPVYLGEIDPNTPLPFSVTIPFAAPTTLSTNSSTSSTSAASATGTATTTTSTNSSSRSGFPSISFTRTGTGSRSFSGAPGGFGGFPGIVNGTRVGAASAGAATIAITLTFKNSFSQNQAQAFSVATTVKTASQLPGGASTAVTTTPSSNAELKDIAYGVVAAVAATLFVGAFMVRRYRAKKLASLPPEHRGEQSVI
jgi:hypothetical protein